jgi:hypothetical protein
MPMSKRTSSVSRGALNKKQNSVNNSDGFFDDKSENQPS